MLLLFAACGDFYVFENEPDSWDGVTMRVLCDSNYVMEGDSMPLLVDFSPVNPDSGAVYWFIPDTVIAKFDITLCLPRLPANCSLWRCRTTDVCRTLLGSPYSNIGIPTGLSSPTRTTW